MRVCTRAHTHTHSYAHTHTHFLSHTHTNTRAHTHSHTPTYTRTQALPSPGELRERMAALGAQIVDLEVRAQSHTGEAKHAKERAAAAQAAAEVGGQACVRGVE